MTKPIIYGVSLGPGDPDLITVKGLDILKKVDKIYYPGSLYSDGKKSSYALSILNHYSLNESKLIGFYLQMSLDRTQAKSIYNTTFKAIKKDVENGLSIAIVSEGDINTFSSFSYLLEKIITFNLSVKLIPGITSYSMAASENCKPLCTLNEKLIILPRVQSEAKLKEALHHFDTVILMKIISKINIIDNVLSCGNYSITYSERLGTPQQYTTTHWDKVKTRKIPYFSLITIRK